jgi:hypothetical protein
MFIARSVALALVALSAASLSVASQEATPETGFDPVARFPAHVLAGTCAEPGEVVYTLAEGGFGLPLPVDADPDSVAAAYVGPNEANPAIVSVTALDAALTAVVAGGHVIDAHRAGGGNEVESRLVCGAVGGFLSGDDLVFGLQEANDSGYRGTAWLHDNGDETTTVTLFLVSAFGAPGAAGVGEAGPSDAAEAAAVPEAVAEAEPLTPLPPAVETTGLVVENGDFAAEGLTLIEGVPTVLHLVNADERDYLFRIDDLVAAREVPANALSVVEFTTPSAGERQAQLLDLETEAVLATIPVTVGVVEALAP